MKKPIHLALLILGTFAFLVAVTHLLDHLRQPAALPLFYPLYRVDAQTSLATIGSLAEVISSLFGIIITVVAIIVNLSANRYTQKIIDIFIKDNINVIVLSLYSITSLYGIWIINAVQSPPNFEPYIPRCQVLFYLFLIILSITLIVPYFYYVFQFLRPKNIISKIKNQIIYALQKASKFQAKAAKIDYLEKEIKPKIIENINHLTEICKSSVKEADQSLALWVLKTMNDIFLNYINCKNDLRPHMPYINKWNQGIDEYFLGVNEPIVDEIKVQRFWLEYKIMQEYESIFAYSFSTDSKVAYRTAINLTEVSAEYVKNRDFIYIHYIIRYFNTLLKICINNNETQNMIYVFYQYYMSCKNLINNYDEKYYDFQKSLILHMANYFKHYGQMGKQKGLDNVLEYSAYFLRLVNEILFVHFVDKDKEFISNILKIFLTVDNLPESEECQGEPKEKRAPLGVRQQQTILACYYLDNKSDFVEQIRSDMLNELDRLDFIIASLKEVKEDRHFEIDNIGINPLFMLGRYKDQLDKFETMFKPQKE